MQQKMASTYWSGSGYYLNAISNDKINGSTKLRRCSVRWEGGFAKVWLPNPRADPDCKITQFSMPLGCWSDDLDWSFHSLHREIGLYLIRSLLWGNISVANQLLLANYGNFNLDYQINIQGEGRKELEGGIRKSVITQSKGGSRL